MEAPVSYPENFARFYDVVYSHLRTVDHDFFLSKIATSNGPVLEIGVGTGRFFIEALDRGADIYGIDVSETMLGQLKGKLNRKQQDRVTLQDVRELSLGRTFNLVVAPFRVFSHLLESEDQLKALNNIYDHLNPGGFFIFDLYVPDLRILLNGIKDQTDFEGEYAPGKRLKRVISSTSDLIRQISHVTMTLSWDELGETRTETWDLRMRYFFRYELEHLVQRSRLTLNTIYGDYSGGALSPASTDFIVVCQRHN